MIRFRVRGLVGRATARLTFSYSSTSGINSLCRGMDVRGDCLIVPESLLRSDCPAWHISGTRASSDASSACRSYIGGLALIEMVEARAVKSAPLCMDETAVLRHTPMHPVPLPAAAWNKVGLDFIGPMDAAHAQRYAVVLAADFSEVGRRWTSLGAKLSRVYIISRGLGVTRSIPPGNCCPTTARTASTFAEITCRVWV